MHGNLRQRHVRGGGMHQHLRHSVLPMWLWLLPGCKCAYPDLVQGVYGELWCGGVCGIELHVCRECRVQRMWKWDLSRCGRIAEQLQDVQNAMCSRVLFCGQLHRVSGSDMHKLHRGEHISRHGWTANLVQVVSLQLWQRILRFPCLHTSSKCWMHWMHRRLDVPGHSRLAD